MEQTSAREAGRSDRPRAIQQSMVDVGIKRGSGETVIALAQVASVPADPMRNLEKAIDCISVAQAAGAHILVFPELFLHGCSSDVSFTELAETVPGPTTARLEAEAKRTGLHIVMGMARTDEDMPFGVYNSACFVGPTGLIGYYDKVHLATHPAGDKQGLSESASFSPGYQAPVFHTDLGRVAIQVCYDAWFPELSRTYALSGAELNVIVAAGLERSQERWSAIVRTRAVENLLPTVFCNAVGHAGDLKFFGASSIVDAFGDVTVEGAADSELVLVGRVDLQQTSRVRRQRRVFTDRRPDVYHL